MIDIGFDFKDGHRKAKSCAPHGDNTRHKPTRKYVKFSGLKPVRGWARVGHAGNPGALANVESTPPERFRSKWKPVRVKKMRQNKN
jgi:hypothetical protein